MAAEIPLKRKYTDPKPKGRNRSDYNGNTGRHRPKGANHPDVPGIKKKRHVTRYQQLRGAGRYRSSI